MQDIPPAIPAVFHQTGPTPLPEWAERYRDTLREWHPRWGYRFWTDDDLERIVRDHYPWLWDTFRRCAIIQKADLGRYCILHRHGGVYCDTDIYWRGPLDPVLERGDPGALWLAHSPRTLPTDAGHDITNYLMASPAGHPFWLEALREAQRRLDHKLWPWWAVNESLRVTCTTGAKMLTPLGRRHSAQIFREPEVLNLFCAHTPVQPGTVAVHNGGTSRAFGGQRSWSSYAKLVHHECSLRKSFGVRGNTCQFPHCIAALYCTLLAVVVVVIGVMAWWCTRWRRWHLRVDHQHTSSAP